MEQYIQMEVEFADDKKEKFTSHECYINISCCVLGESYKQVRGDAILALHKIIKRCDENIKQLVAEEYRQKAREAISP